MKSIFKHFLPILFLLVNYGAVAQNQAREKLLLDFGWKFAYGHPFDPAKDFNNGTSYFSYLTKAGYGDGAAAKNFDDRAWRDINLPHDYAVIQPFSEKGSFSHGFKAIGRNFPEVSVGWYRKTFQIPKEDLGKKITVSFDGVFRNSIVWLNGHYLGTELSGYDSFEYDLTDYINYGGENVIAVRTDATMEEGWFYEGAGIYRHVWLNKSNKLHVASNGTFVRTEMDGSTAKIKVRTTLINQDVAPRTFLLKQQVLNRDGKILESQQSASITLKPLEHKDIEQVILLRNARLWSLDDPYLHRLQTIISESGKIVDNYLTKFGIRTIRFDANEGFFLNGKHIKITGTNNHQDHAGVGAAMPDELQYFRIRKLKEFGNNAYRCSHNPPTPQLLEACDSLGVLVIDETRLMGINDYHLNTLKKLILRDRNHPSIISWSVGNEEWGIENDVVGARIVGTMQNFAKSLDSTRAITAAISGGVGVGISTAVDMLGYNYIRHKDTDKHHATFPQQLSWGTEEGSTVTTRGVYVDDLEKHYLSNYDRPQNDHFFSLEDGWKYYVKRPYLAGMFIWTGFDYRGEPTPFGWPSVTSYFGMLDLCGFPKDYYYYLRSWWTQKPTIHIFPHWNWSGKEGQNIPVWVYSNADEVELFLNRKSLGKKQMPKNGHLSWEVAYVPGTLEAIGYKNGKREINDVVKTTGEASNIRLTAHQNSIKANREDIAVITVDVLDKNKLHQPTASQEIEFSIEGPGKLIGVGNGDPTSLENEQFLSEIQTFEIANLQEKLSETKIEESAVSDLAKQSGWQKAFADERLQAFGEKYASVLYKGEFNLPANYTDGTFKFFFNSIGKQQSVYVNGKQLASNIAQSKNGNTFDLDVALLKEGKNEVLILTTPLTKKQSWETVNSNPGLIQMVVPAPAWKRKLFNGLAQVIVQSTGGTGDIILKAKAPGLKEAILKIPALPAPQRPAIP
ncbi:beta-galactosidase GalA [Pelobium manganitolerans]|uniref:beta-galactosidase GalA n=1 Tax=Pelobium manganitolerans TaxID=1842495 RepID=UPI003FA3579C